MPDVTVQFGTVDEYLTMPSARGGEIAVAARNREMRIAFKCDHGAVGFWVDPVDLPRIIDLFQRVLGVYRDAAPKAVSIMPETEEPDGTTEPTS